MIVPIVKVFTKGNIGAFMTIIKARRLALILASRLNILRLSPFNAFYFCESLAQRSHRLI